RDFHCASAIKRHPAKNRVLLLPVEEVCGGDSKLRHTREARLRRNVPQLYQPVGGLKWQGLQEDRANDAEDGRVRSDSERHDQNSDGGEPWALQQMSDCEF